MVRLDRKIKQKSAGRYGRVRRSKSKSKVEKIAFSLEHSKFLEYIDSTRKPRWLVLRHFFMGAARGVGLTIGTALVIAISIWLLQHIISMNIPFLTEMLKDFVQFVKEAATSVPTPDVSKVSIGDLGNTPSP